MKAPIIDATRAPHRKGDQTLIPVTQSGCKGCFAEEVLDARAGNPTCHELRHTGIGCAANIYRNGSHPSVIWVVPTPEMLEQHAVEHAIWRMTNESA